MERKPRIGSFIVDIPSSFIFFHSPYFFNSNEESNSSTLLLDRKIGKKVNERRRRCCQRTTRENGGFVFDSTRWEKSKRRGQEKETSLLQFAILIIVAFRRSYFRPLLFASIKLESSIRVQGIHATFQKLLCSSFHRNTS